MDLDRNPHVVCVILNWNGWQDTIACLEALKECTYPNKTIVVVDNASTNDSVVKIRAADSNIVLLESLANLGFAGGNNIGIRYALAHSAEYIWLLNNDTKPAPDALSALVEKAMSDKHIGAVASVCYYIDKPEDVQIWAGGRAYLWIGYTPYSTKPHHDAWFHWLNGTSLLVSGRAFQNAGLLDEGFFLYCEDSEFCLRLRKTGWKLAAAPDSRVLHKVSASTGGSKLLFDQYSTASGLRILRLHSPAPYMAMPLFIFIRFSMRIIRFQHSRCASVWAGVRDYFRTPPDSRKVADLAYSRLMGKAPGTKEDEKGR